MIALFTLLAGLFIFLIPACGETSANSSDGKDAFAQAASRTRSRIDRAAVKFDGQIMNHPHHQQSYIREKWALFVGINQFQDSQIQPSKVASNNALLIAWALKDPTIGRFTPSHVASLIGASATKATVQNAIIDSALIRKALPDDLIILYFSTRLLPLTSENDVLLCAYDTSLAQAATSGIKLSEVLSNLQKLTQCQQIICILDCNNASTTNNANSVSLEEVAKRTGVTIISANQIGDDSITDKKGTFSCFSRYLATGLKETHGTASLQYLITYVQDYLARDNQKEPSARPQTVCFITANEGSKMNEIIVGAPPLGAWYAAEMANQVLARAQIETPASPIEALEAKSKADSQLPKGSNSKGPKVDFAPWMSKMKKDIRNKWNCPPGYEHEHTSVIFSIMRDGSIFNPYVEESSGVPIVDQSTIEAIKAASPLLPLPEGAPDFVRVRYLFDWRVSHKY